MLRTWMSPVLAPLAALAPFGFPVKPPVPRRRDTEPREPRSAWAAYVADDAWPMAQQMAKAFGIPSRETPDALGYVDLGRPDRWEDLWTWFSGESWRTTQYLRSCIRKGSSDPPPYTRLSETHEPQPSAPPLETNAAPQPETETKPSAPPLEPDNVSLYLHLGAVYTRISFATYQPYTHKETVYQPYTHEPDTKDTSVDPRPPSYGQASHRVIITLPMDFLGNEHLKTRLLEALQTCAKTIPRSEVDRVAVCIQPVHGHNQVSFLLKRHRAVTQT